MALYQSHRKLLTIYLKCTTLTQSYHNRMVWSSLIGCYLKTNFAQVSSSTHAFWKILLGILPPPLSSLGILFFELLKNRIDVI
jgi:hypothetical protein